MRSMHSRVARIAIPLGGRFPNFSVRSFVTSRQPSPAADPHLFKLVYEIDTKMAVAGHFKSRPLNVDDLSPSRTAVIDNIAKAATPGVPREVTIRNFIRAADVTAVAFAKAMHATGSGAARSEADVSNKMEFEMMTLGARGFAYEPVIASGTRSLALHYIRNDAPLHQDELIRVDAGADFFGHPIDCSRTWPVSGKWKCAGQLALYEAVLRIQRALIEMCQDGTCVDDIARAAQELTRKTLIDLGVMGREAGTPNSAAALVDLLFPHSFGHFFGHDIHERIPRSSKLVPESMHTVEPGIYIPQAPSNETEAAAIKKRYGDLLDIERIPPELRGLGICIEDVVCVLPSNPIDRKHLSVRCLMPSRPVLAVAQLPDT